MKIKHLLLLPIAIILCACSMAEDIKEADSAVGSFLDGRINTGTMGNDDFYSVLFKEATS